MKRWIPTWRLRLFLTLCLLTLMGCGGTSSTTPADPPAPTSDEELSADQVLERMVRVYQDAERYRDRGRLRLAYRVADRVEENLAPLSVNYDKSQLSVTAYQCRFVVRGETLQASIEDEATGNLDSQVVRRPLSGEPLTLRWLYKDKVLANLLNSGLGRQPITLELLLGEKPLEGFRSPEAKRELLSEKEIDGSRCRRLKVSTAEGPFVMWIDKESFTLHRMEYPTEEVAADLDRRFGATDVQLTAEFYGAEFEAPSSTRFEFAAPEAAKIVQQFVTPPQPLPSALFGQQPPPFSFTDPNTGETTPSESLKGKATALLWVSDHPAGEQSVKQLEQLRLENENLQLVVVSSDPQETTDEAVLSMVDRWGWKGRIVRDVEAVGRDVFDIDLLPTLVVLNEQGAVQVFDEGHNATMAKDLARVFAMLERGEDVAATVVQQAENERLRYQAALIREGVAPEAAQPDEAQIVFRDPTRPFEFAWSPAWRTNELQAPGNILAIPDSGSLWINEGWRSIAEVDPRDGSVKKRITLDLPDDASVSRLTTPHGELRGKVFAASDLLGRQAHVFDDQWKRLVSYPDPEEKHSGIRDVSLADLNADGSWQLAVGFWELLGVHGVDSRGQRLWGNRECGSVQNVAISAPSSIGWRQWLVVGDTGRVHQLNHQGKADPAIRPSSGLVDQLYSAGPSSPASESPYCVISVSPSGKRTVRGLSPSFDEVWAYDSFPSGAHRNRVQYVSSGRIRLKGQMTPTWLLVGPDGSVHLISHDGAFNDFFYAGKAVDGASLWDDGERALLLLSYGGEVLALEVDVK